LGYRLASSNQNNRQPGREKSDFINTAHAFSFGVTPFAILSLNFDVGFDGAESKESSRIDRTRRYAMNAALQLTQSSAISAGQGVVHSGAVAGFPLPPLRYFVGSMETAAVIAKAGELQLLSPADSATIAPAQAITLSWVELKQAAVYQLEIQDRQQQAVFSAFLNAGVSTYSAPSWMRDRAGDGWRRWRVKAVDLDGETVAESGWRTLVLGDSAPLK
jgi:hypothetical protein